MTRALPGPDFSLQMYGTQTRVLVCSKTSPLTSIHHELPRCLVTLKLEQSFDIVLVSKMTVFKVCIVSEQRFAAPALNEDRDAHSTEKWHRAHLSPLHDYQRFPFSSPTTLLPSLYRTVWKKCRNIWDLLGVQYVPPFFLFFATMQLSR